MKVRGVAVAALLLTSAAIAVRFALNWRRQAGAATVTEALRCDVNQRHDGFRVTQIRAGGNSLEAYRKVPTCFAESDFQLTPHGAVIAAHDDDMTGSCGMIRESTPRLLRTCRMANGHHVAHLSDFLRVPLTEWFLDLKSTMSEKDEHVVRAVQEVIDEIRAAGRKQGAVLMMYRAPPAAVELVHKNNIRAAMKGYPETIEGTRQLVREAKKNGFEMVCVNISVIDQDVVEYAKGLGVWLLAWEAGGEKPIAYWQGLAHAGLGGLITDSTDVATKAMSPPIR